MLQLLVLVCLLLVSGLHGRPTDLSPVDSNSTDSCQWQCPSKNKTLYLLALGPFPDSTPGLSPGWEGGPAVIPGSQVAVRHLNCRCDVLEDYRLELLVYDSGCSVKAKALESFAEGVLNPTGKGLNVVGIIGPGCSAAATTIGDLLARPKLSLLDITPSATSPELENTTRFPNTFRPIGSSKSFINGYYSMILQLNFTDIAIFYESDRPIHSAAANTFEEILTEANLSVNLYGLSGSSIPLSEVENQVRVIFVFSASRLATQLICLAYNRSMLYPEYQFVFSERLVQHFLVNVSFTFGGERYRCTDAEMRKAINGSILNNFQFARSDWDAVLVSNRTYTQFVDEYQVALQEYMDQLGLASVVETEHQNDYYDSVWALALALNASVPRLRDELNSSLSNYSYGNPKMTDVIRSELLRLNFQGVRGTTRFSNETHGGEDTTIIRVLQVTDGSTMLVGRYDPSSEEGLVFERRDAIIQNLFDPAIVAVPYYVEVIVLVLVVLVTALTVFFHVINLAWNRVGTIKATSPALNNFIFLGCYLYILSIIFVSFEDVIKDQHPRLSSFKCMGFFWCESIALTLIYGTICVKTWRLLRIFSHTSAKMLKHLHTYQLALAVLGAVALDAVVNLVWNLVDPWDLEEVARNPLRHRYVCQCRYVLVWTGFLVGLKVLLAVTVVYLAIATRQIPKKEYKQTKATNSLVYIFIVIYCLLVPTYIIFQQSLDQGLVILSYLSICFKNILCVLMCNLLIFLPPVLPALKERWGGCGCLKRCRSKLCPSRYDIGMTKSILD